MYVCTQIYRYIDIAGDAGTSRDPPGISEASPTSADAVHVSLVSGCLGEIPSEALAASVMFVVCSTSCAQKRQELRQGLMHRSRRTLHHRRPL